MKLCRMSSNHCVTSCIQTGRTAVTGVDPLWWQHHRVHENGSTPNVEVIDDQDDGGSFVSSADHDVVHSAGSA